MLRFLAAEGDFDSSAVQGLANTAYKTFIQVVNIILPIIMGVLLVLGMYYGIMLGVKYAKADDDDSKKKAKDSLVNVIIGVIIAILFVAIIEIILNQNFIKSLFSNIPEDIKNSATAFFRI